MPRRRPRNEHGLYPLPIRVAAWIGIPVAIIVAFRLINLIKDRLPFPWDFLALAGYGLAAALSAYIGSTQAKKALYVYLFTDDEIRAPKWVLDYESLRSRIDLHRQELSSKGRRRLIEELKASRVSLRELLDGVDSTHASTIEERQDIRRRISKDIDFLDWRLDDLYRHDE